MEEGNNDWFDEVDDVWKGRIESRVMDLDLKDLLHECQDRCRRAVFYKDGRKKQEAYVAIRKDIEERIKLRVVRSILK